MWLSQNALWICPPLSVVDGFFVAVFLLEVVLLGVDDVSVAEMVVVVAVVVVLLEVDEVEGNLRNGLGNTGVKKPKGTIDWLIKIFCLFFGFSFYNLSIEPNTYCTYLYYCNVRFSFFYHLFVLSLLLHEYGTRMPMVHWRQNEGREVGRSDRDMFGRTIRPNREWATRWWRSEKALTDRWSFKFKLWQMFSKFWREIWWNDRFIEERQSALNIFVDFFKQWHLREF